MSIVGCSTPLFRAISPKRMLSSGWLQMRGIHVELRDRPKLSHRRKRAKRTGPGSTMNSTNSMIKTMGLRRCSKYSGELLFSKHDRDVYLPPSLPAAATSPTQPSKPIDTN
jgi:hypothetical protein